MKPSLPEAVRINGTLREYNVIVMYWQNLYSRI